MLLKKIILPFSFFFTHYRRNGGSVCGCTDNRLNTDCHERKPLDAHWEEKAAQHWQLKITWVTAAVSRKHSKAAVSQYSFLNLLNKEISFILASSILFHQHLIKEQHFEQKVEKISFLSNTTPGSYSVLLSKQRCSRWLPSSPLKLAQSFTTSWMHISLGNIRRFSFICCLLLMASYMRSLVSSSSSSVFLIGTF